MKNVIVINMTNDYSDYRFGVIDCATGKPTEMISLYCSGSGIETEYLFKEIRRVGLYSDFCEQPCNTIGGKRPVDIKNFNWFGGIISEIVLAGIKANRNYNILHTYGMTINDGWVEFYNSVGYEKDF